MTEGMIFDIQHYAVHDGPGIRTLVFLKGCPLRCLWCCNPESQNFGSELRHSMVRCQTCYTCKDPCTAGAIREGETGPLMDREACRVCKTWPCVEACPQGALAVMGRAMTAEDVVARLAADAAFYENSGGGVTFSGGEPFAQPEFLEDLLLRCKVLGIRSAVETCGHVPEAAILEIEPLIGLFLFDVKAMDPRLHERCTGASNELILKNLRALAERDASKITVRVPLVPGYTDAEENLSAIASLTAELGIRKAELMPYHELGRDKYEGLGRPYPITLQDPHPLSAQMEAALRIFRERGVACESGGE